MVSGLNARYAREGGERCEIFYLRCTPPPLISGVTWGRRKATSKIKHVCVSLTHSPIFAILPPSMLFLPPCRSRLDSSSSLHHSYGSPHFSSLCLPLSHTPPPSLQGALVRRVVHPRGLRGGALPVPLPASGPLAGRRCVPADHREGGTQPLPAGVHMREKAARCGLLTSIVCSLRYLFSPSPPSFHPYLNPPFPPLSSSLLPSLLPHSPLPPSRRGCSEATIILPPAQLLVLLLLPASFLSLPIIHHPYSIPSPSLFPLSSLSPSLLLPRRECWCCGGLGVFYYFVPTVRVPENQPLLRAARGRHAGQGRPMHKRECVCVWERVRVRV